MNIQRSFVAFLVALFGWCSQAFAQSQETRVALVIGNGSYKNSPLKNPVNDARDMAVKLRGLGFTVIERDNLVVKQIGSTLREFRSKLTPGSVALVFYAGHGVQIKGENYFPSVDADIQGEEDIPNQSLAMRQIMDVLAEAKTRLNLVFLDACRDNPYARSFRSASRGLSKEAAPSGTLISFATRPGSVASDGDGRNGLYTGALLQAMDNKHQPIEQVLKRVVSSVKAYSKNQQEPWMEGSIEGEFCFGSCIAASQIGISDERALWESVKDSRDLNELKVYIAQFPRGVFAGLANTRIKAMEQSEAPQVVTVTSQPLVSSDKPFQFGETIKDCDVCPEMVSIPSGAFLMGSKDDPFSSIQVIQDEHPRHLVSVNSFLIGKYEITQEQWYSLMGSMPSKFKGKTLPVEQVSWLEIQEYMKKLNDRTGKKYLLPSEAQWEYAARAGGAGVYWFGDSPTELGRFAWFYGNSNNQTHPVGEKQPNSYGLYDMNGNVWEWTSDCWNASYVGAPKNDAPWLQGDCSKRVIRGGAWRSDPVDLRNSNRVGDVSSNESPYVGFRVVRVP